MTELRIIGAGIAGLSAALGALDGGVSVTLLEAGGPPEPGRRFDLWLEDAFAPFGAVPPVSLSWTCTRLLGVDSESGFRARPGYLVDREALRQDLLAAALGRGATVHWRQKAALRDERLWIGGAGEAPGPLIVAADLVDGEPRAEEAAWYSQWTGTGTPTSSYVARARPAPGGGNVVQAMSGPDQWVMLGWHADEQTVPAGAESATLLRRSRRRSPLAPDRPLSGPGWLRVGTAANFVPRHGFGLAQELAASRVSGFLAAHWVRTNAPAEDWQQAEQVMALIRFWLREGLPLRLR